jgi:hypothetical protein
MDFRLPRAAADEVVVLRVYDAMLDHLDQYGENQAEVLAAATPGQRAIYALCATDGEVNNGGFAQFFTNATGALIGEAIAGAERTGLHTHSAILCEAANVFPGGKVPEDFDERNDVWDSFPERKLEDELNPLDDRWYAAEDEFLPRLERYVLRDHPEEFFRWPGTCLGSSPGRTSIGRRATARDVHRGRLATARGAGLGRGRRTAAARAGSQQSARAP